MIMNILLVLIVLFFVIIVILMIMILHAYIQKHCCNCGKSFCQYLMNKLMYNSVIRGLLEAYFMMSVAAIYEISKVFHHGIYDGLNLSIAIITILYLQALPILSLLFLRRNFKILDTRRMKSKFGTLY